MSLDGGATAIDTIKKSFFIFSSSLIISWLLLPRLAHLALNIGLVDHPDRRRKIHRHPKPLVGGVAMSLAVCFSCLLFVPLTHFRGFYAGAILLVIIGFLDDFKEIDHRWKFIAQIIATLMMAYYSRTVLYTFGNLLNMGEINFGNASIIMTVIGTVGVINAMNMIDGLDGLAGGISLVAFASFGVLAFLDNKPELMLLCISLCGAIVPFLYYNWHPSRLFMGDAGSLFLGFAAAFVSIAVTQDQYGHIERVRPVVALLVMAVPITDTLTVMIRRVMKGRSPFHADKHHLHHILLRLHLTKKQVAIIIIGVSLVFSSIAISGTIFDMRGYKMFLVFFLYFAVCFISSFYIKDIVRRRKKIIAVLSPSEK